MEEYGYSCAETEAEGLRYGHAHCQSVREVVHGISEYYDPGQGLYACDVAQTAGTTLDEEGEDDHLK